MTRRATSPKNVSASLNIPVGSIGPRRGRCLDKLRRDPVIAAVVDLERRLVVFGGILDVFVGVQVEAVPPIEVILRQGRHARRQADALTRRTAPGSIRIRP